MDLPKKFTVSRFMLYDEKSDPISHVSYDRQMMALLNHLDALMKWFDRLPIGSIRSYHQLAVSFVAQFIINKKELKGIGSFLTLKNGKNK